MDVRIARELVEQARAEGVSLVGEGGLGRNTLTWDFGQSCPETALSCGTPVMSFEVGCMVEIPCEPGTERSVNGWSRNGRRMNPNVYLIDKIGYLAQRDSDFLAVLRADPAAAVDRFPLDAAYRELLLAGDVAELYRRGAHPLLLSRLAVYQVLGLDPQSYSDRIRVAGRATSDRS